MKKQITIQTEKGFQVLDLEISFDNDDIDEASVMTIKTNYQGKEIIASGNSYPWEDAYANLQNQLPENVKLICCVCSNQRLTNNNLQGLISEIVVDVSLIDCDLARTGHKINPGNTALPSTCTIKSF